MSQRQQHPSSDRLEEQNRHQREQQATQFGLGDAQQGTIDMSEFGGSDLIEDFSDADVAADEDDDLDKLLAAEFSRHLAFGNIDMGEYKRQSMLDRARARMTKMEFPREGRIGSRCRGRFREIMVPDSEGRPILSDYKAREIDAAFEERTMARSLSKNARGFRGVTEAIVETRSKSDADDGGSGGLMSRLFG